MFAFLLVLVNVIISNTILNYCDGQSYPTNGVSYLDNRIPDKKFHLIKISPSDENEAIQFLKDLNNEMGILSNKYTIAAWNFETNLTKTNAIVSERAQAEVC